MDSSRQRLAFTECLLWARHCARKSKSTQDQEQDVLKDVIKSRMWEEEMILDYSVGPEQSQVTEKIGTWMWKQTEKVMCKWNREIQPQAGDSDRHPKLEGTRKAFSQSPGREYGPAYTFISIEVEPTSYSGFQNFQRIYLFFKLG